MYFDRNFLRVLIFGLMIALLFMFILLAVVIIDQNLGDRKREHTPPRSPQDQDPDKAGPPEKKPPIGGESPLEGEPSAAGREVQPELKPTVGRKDSLRPPAFSEDLRERESHQPEDREQMPACRTEAPRDKWRPTELKIVIKGITEYKPVQMDHPYRFPGKRKAQGGKQFYLFFTRQDFGRLQSALGWGRRTKANVVEQGGILLGSTAIYQNEVYCFAEDFLLADTKGEPAFVEFTSEMWTEMQEQLYAMNAKRGQRTRLSIIGWFHTHPNGLQVFMSGTDMNTQQQGFSQEWQVSLVMNPHRNIYRAFFGKYAREGEVVLLDQL